MFPTDEMAAATARVRAWFRADVLRRLERPAVSAGVPLRLPLSGPRDLTPTARDVRKPRRSELANRRVPRKRGQKPGCTPWNKNHDLTAEAIVEGFGAGQSIKEQAAKYKMVRSAISRRLHNGLKQSKQLLERYTALLSCACGVPKHAHSRKCRGCLRTKTVRPRPNKKQGN